MARVGVLALQGDFAEHLLALTRCGVQGTEVRTPEELDGVDRLIIPGGESTTILKLMDRFGLREPLQKRVEAGMPVFGTCAGGIVLASHATDGEEPLHALDVSVRRNAYGRQVESFETEIDLEGVEGGPVKAVFIRAPIFEKPGAGVEVLASHGGAPVALRTESILVTSFHPELTDDSRVHQYFLDTVPEKDI